MFINIVNKYIFLFLFISFSYTQSNVFITEIMFFCDGDNNEFIELFNNSPTDSVDITSLKIRYYNNTPDDIIPVYKSIKLPPFSYAIILEGDYDFSDSYYNFPENTIIFKIKDSAFGRSGLSNTSDRLLQLLDKSGNIIDEYTYSANNNKGFSDEKIVINQTLLSANWSNSVVFGGTPGKTNSVSKPLVDYSVKFVTTIPAIIKTENSFKIFYSIENNGILNSEYIQTTIFSDENYDKMVQENEIISQKFLSTQNLIFPVIDSVTINYFKKGKSLIGIEISIPEDTIFSNNKDFWEINILEPLCGKNELVINEVMFAPDNDLPEWIELYNNSNKALDLNSSYLCDNSTFVKIQCHKTIPPNDYLIITSEETLIKYYDIKSNYLICKLPVLNNNGDKIILKDSLNNTLDSLDYTFFSNYKSGFSIERLSVESYTNNRDNWKISSNKKGGTPGLINSVSKKEFDLSIKELKYFPEFPTPNDKIKLQIVVKNNGQYECDGYLDIKYGVYSLKSDTFLVFPNDSTLVNIILESINLNTGIESIINLISLKDQDTSNNKIFKKLLPIYNLNSLLINEIQFTPENGEPEWVELLNITNNPININNFSLSDKLITPQNIKLATHDIIINPGSFLIISKDTSIFDYHKTILCPVVITNLPVLNNDKDGVIIYDSYNNVIDSVNYLNNIKAGYSLERKYLSTDLKQNWFCSKDIEKSTPGRKNSISPLDYDLALKHFYSLPELIKADEKICVHFCIKNEGIKEISRSNLNIKINGELLLTTNIPNLKPNDSTFITSDYFTIKDSCLIYVHISTDTDENLVNNSYSVNLKCGYRKESLLFSEIMINPRYTTEWVELYNNSDKDIDLKGFQIFNNKSNIKTIITSSEYILKPDSYITLVNGSINNINQLKCNFGNLLETEGELIIKDFNLTTLDSIRYVNWISFNKHSFERVSFNKNTNDLKNWKESIDKSGNSNGLKNSVSNLCSALFGDILITEIMYNPYDNNSEFIELYNNSQKIINLGGWSFLRSGKYRFKITPFSYWLNPSEYFVVASDSNFINFYNPININYYVSNEKFTLLNQSDIIKLFDYSENIIDSIQYDDRWHNQNFIITQNRSLEKINLNGSGFLKTNWSSSTDPIGATPINQNSLFINSSEFKESFFLTPNPFSPDNDGFEDFLSINYNIPYEVTQITIRIFDRSGYLVKTLTNNLSAGSKNTIIYDGKDDNGNYLDTGVYILLFEANPGGVFKKPLVIVRK